MCTIIHRQRKNKSFKIKEEEDLEMARISFLLGILLIIISVMTACNVSVNKTVKIRDGEKRDSNINTVNGSIIIGENCDIRGKCRTVNGHIEVGSDSRVKELQTINGSIRIDSNTIVKNDVETINGSVTCESGVKISGSINTINGRIKLSNSEVSRNVETINGNITLSDKSIVHGDIIVKKSKGISHRTRSLKIRLSNESVVEGDIIVKDRDIKVEVYLSDGSKVLGQVKNAEVISY